MVSPDIVFIDTSVFIAENFFAPGNRINSLKKLAIDKKISIVMSIITIQEVRKHIISSVRDSWKEFNRECKIFRNHPEIDSWRKSTSETEESKRILDLFEAFLSSSRVIVLDYSYCSNTEKVFLDYFGKQKPFGDGMKKDEFPDAFVLSSLEKFSEEKHRKIVILSADSDITGYASEHFIHVDYRSYISDKVAEGIALEEMVRLLKKESQYLEHDIQTKVFDYLDDSRLYLTNLNLTDVSSLNVENVTVVLNEANYEVVSVNDKFIELELQPKVSFKVSIEYINYEYAVYDREDGEWYGTQDEEYEVDGETLVTVTLRYILKSTPFFSIVDLDFSSLVDEIE